MDAESACVFFSEKSIDTSGVYAQGQWFWLLYTPPALLEETLKEKVQEFSAGANLTHYSIENANNLDRDKVILRYSFAGQEFFTNAGNLRIAPQVAGADTSAVAKEKRTYPLDFGLLDSKETLYEIKLPEKFALRFLPESVTEDNQWIYFNAQYSFEGNTILFKQTTSLKKTAIALEEYQDFKNFMEGLARKVKQRIVLERREK